MKIRKQGRRLGRVSGFAFLLLALILSSCAGISPNETPHELLSHQINVPKEFRGGDPTPHFDGDMSRYVYHYEAGWWDCVARYAADIEHQAIDGDKMGNGWPSEVSGYWDGATDCEIRVKKIIAKVGKQRAQKIFAKALQMPAN